MHEEDKRGLNPLTEIENKTWRDKSYLGFGGFWERIKATFFILNGRVIHGAPLNASVLEIYKSQFNYIFRGAKEPLRLDSEVDTHVGILDYIFILPFLFLLSLFLIDRDSHRLDRVIRGILFIPMFIMDLLKGAVSVTLTLVTTMLILPWVHWAAYNKEMNEQAVKKPTASPLPTFSPTRRAPTGVSVRDLMGFLGESAQVVLPERDQKPTPIPLL